jgi:uncharacterized protein YkwD
MNLQRCLYTFLGWPLLSEEAPPSLDSFPMTAVFIVPDPNEVTYYRKVLLDVHNMYRGSVPLVISEDLCKAAQEHCDSMARRRKLDHDQFAARAKKYGLRAENVAWGHTEPEMVWYHKTAGWYYSQAHRQNAINPSYRKVGFGKNGVYWTAVYA